MNPYLGFWKTIARPIIALSPMDGVTDFACRAMAARHGRPDVLFTEFTHVVGMMYAPQRVLRDFEYSEIERPVVAQVFGSTPDDFYRAAHVVCELGFDGIDINMGCPAKKVVEKNGGAQLITMPHLAREILAAVRSGIRDWVQGSTLESLNIPSEVIEAVTQMNQRRSPQSTSVARRLLPYSVKTRIGYDQVAIEPWIENLLSEQPAAISIHGRTLKQMYRGQADWQAIARAATIARGSGTLILGNGDLDSLAEAERRIRETGVDGVLIGRSSIGNPWIFRRNAIKVPFQERLQVALQHADYFVRSRGETNFRVVRKHLAGYFKGFPHAAALRMSSLQTTNMAELRSLLMPHLSEAPAASPSINE